MITVILRCISLSLVCLQLLACSSHMPDISVYPRSLHSCVNSLVDFKQQVARQRATDAQLFWSKAYPHLAFGRFSLSLINELNSNAERDQWLNYVTQQAAEQRSIEYQNLTDKGRVRLDQLDACASDLARANLEDEKFWLRLQSTPPVYPSDYQNWQRVLGLYPITKAFLRPLIRNEKLRIKRDYLEPVADNAVTYALNYAAAPQITAQLTALSANPDSAEQEFKREAFYQQVAGWFSQARATSNLAWPQLTEEQTTALLYYFAPHWQIETAGADDQPGLVEYDNKGRAWVDPWQPTLYTHLSYTRFQGQILPQLNYLLWFANRTATSHFDPYAGRFDSVLIRLTLNKNGRPYIIDSIHSCGCYHVVFSLDPALTFTTREPESEQPIRMHLAEYAEFKIPFTVTLSAGEHMVKSLNWYPLGEHKQLTLLPYSQLRSLAFQPDQNRSLFDNEGMLTASQRFERWFLWPFGVRSPGTMRQVGHHAIAFIGQRHFDDPFIFESFF